MFLYDLVNVIFRSVWVILRILVLLNLLYELAKKDKMRGCAEHLSVLPNKFNKFNNIGARMQDSIYHNYDTKITFY